MFKYLHTSVNSIRLTLYLRPLVSHLDRAASHEAHDVEAERATSDVVRQHLEIVVARTELLDPVGEDGRLAAPSVAGEEQDGLVGGRRRRPGVIHSLLTLQ